MGLFGQLDMGGGRKKEPKLRSARRALTWLGMWLKVPVAQEVSRDERLSVVVRVLQRHQTNQRVRVSLIVKNWLQQELMFQP